MPVQLEPKQLPQTVAIPCTPTATTNAIRNYANIFENATKQSRTNDRHISRTRVSTTSTPERRTVDFSQVDKNSSSSSSGTPAIMPAARRAAAEVSVRRRSSSGCIEPPHRPESRQVVASKISPLQARMHKQVVNILNNVLRLQQVVQSWTQPCNASSGDYLELG